MKLILWKLIAALKTDLFRSIWPFDDWLIAAFLRTKKCEFPNTENEHWKISQSIFLNHCGQNEPAKPCFFLSHFLDNENLCANQFFQTIFPWYLLNLDFIINLSLDHSIFVVFIFPINYTLQKRKRILWQSYVVLRIKLNVCALSCHVVRHMADIYPPTKKKFTFYHRQQ